jgi:hypothetical protein
MRGEELMQPEANLPKSYKSKTLATPLEKTRLQIILRKEQQFQISPEA